MRSRVSAAAWAAMAAALAGAGAARGGATVLTPSGRIETGPAARVQAAEDAARRMTVPVQVDGRGPYPFVIDTGADRTVISRELAGELGLKPGDPVELNGTGGVDLTPTARIGELVVGPRSTRDVSAPTLAETNLGARGLLGIDSLRDQRIVMDFEHHAMSVQPSRKERYGTDVIVVTAKSRYGQLILVDASVSGTPVAVIVDSGAETSIGNRALQRLVGAERAERDPVQVVSVSGRATPAHFATVPRVRIGGASIRNLPVAFADIHTFGEFGLNDTPAMLLGMDVMRQFDRVVVDFGRKQVSFRFPVDG